MYLGALDVYTTELTKANKLDEARKIKALRDDLATKKPEAVSAAVAPAKAEPPKPFTTITTKTPEVKPPTGSYWRAAAKWLVANGSGGDHGSKGRITADGKESEIKTEQDIPSGKFDFIELDFGTGTEDLTDEGFQVLRGQKDLRKIKVASMDSPGLSDAGFAFLADNKDLTYVETYNLENIGDGLFVHLSGLKKITTLKFSGAKKLTGKGIDNLACLPVLTNVILGRCAALTDDALKALGACQKLTFLEIAETPITDAGLAALISAGSLQNLNISDCKNITTEGFVALRKLKSLTRLNVKNTSFGDAGAAAVADIKSLTKLDLSDTKITDAGLAKLTVLTRLSEISLWKTQVTDAGLAKLTTLTNLETIGLRNTKVTNEGVAAFKKALPNCKVER